MNKRQKKKAFCQKHGYNPGEEEWIQQIIRDTIQHTECRMVETKKCCTYSGFLASIKQRPRNKNCWWKRVK